LHPLLGDWRFSGHSPLGKVVSERSFSPVLGGKFVELRASWRTAGKAYEERAFFGAKPKEGLVFWSFTSDGGYSFGRLSKGVGLPAPSICFEAEMPAGLARMAYWPHEQNGFVFVVEARGKKGWERFVEQHFEPAS
jgi:hypothetical protein